MQILLAGPGDYNMNGASSRCIEMVQHAATNRQSRLMFTPTLFWVDSNFQQRKSVNSQVQSTLLPSTCCITVPACTRMKTISIKQAAHLHLLIGCQYPQRSDAYCQTEK